MLIPLPAYMIKFNSFFFFIELSIPLHHMTCVLCQYKTSDHPRMNVAWNIFDCEKSRQLAG